MKKYQVVFMGIGILATVIAAIWMPGLAITFLIETAHHMKAHVYPMDQIFGILSGIVTFIGTVATTLYITDRF